MQKSWARLPLRQKSNYYFQFNKPGTQRQVVMVAVLLNIGDRASLIKPAKLYMYIQNIICNQVMSCPGTVAPLNQTRLDKTLFHRCTVELQWLEHRWLVYHGYFELVLESMGKNPIAADIIIFGIIYCAFSFLYL